MTEAGPLCEGIMQVLWRISSQEQSVTNGQAWGLSTFLLILLTHGTLPIAICLQSHERSTRLHVSCSRLARGSLSDSCTICSSRTRVMSQTSLLSS